MIKIVLLLSTVSLCACEEPAGSPWRLAFYPNNVPAGEYGAPPLPTRPTVEVSRENIEYAVHLVEFGDAHSHKYPPSHASYHFRRPKLSSTSVSDLKMESF